MHHVSRSTLVIGFIILGIILWFLSGLFVSRTPENGAIQAPVPRVEVKTSKAVQRTLELVIRGHTEGNGRVTLRAETASAVEYIGAVKGGDVTAGEEIVRLNPEDRHERLAQAQATLAQRKLEYDAAQKLVRKEFRSKTTLAKSKADLKEAEAELSLFQTTLDNTHIRAPFDGVLADRYVEVGDYVAVGDKIAMVVELNPLKVVANVAEQDIPHVKEQTISRIRLASGQEVEGVVKFVGSVADPETRTFVVELQVDNPNHLIRDGLTAEVYIPINIVPAHRISPAILSLNDQGTVGVKSVNGNSLVKFHPVKIIGHEEDGLWVTGLPETIDLITTGQDYTIAGEKVIAVKS